MSYYTDQIIASNFDFSRQRKWAEETRNTILSHFLCSGEQSLWANLFLFVFDKDFYCLFAREWNLVLMIFLRTYLLSLPCRPSLGPYWDVIISHPIANETLKQGFGTEKKEVWEVPRVPGPLSYRWEGISISISILKIWYGHKVN